MSGRSVADKPAFGLPGRIQDANSRKRSIAIVGLGSGGTAVAQRLSQSDLGELDVHVVAAPRGSAEDAIAKIKSNGDDMHRAVRDADMIFIVACHGDDVSLAPVVSRLAHDHNAPVTAVYLVPPAAGSGAPVLEDQTLKTLRTGAEMLVIASDESYVAAMVAALGC
jgi:cell division GTPase FtsZ